MQGDFQPVVVDLPQSLKNPLGLRAGVDEDQRHGVGFERRIDVGHRVKRRVAGPGNALPRRQDGDVGPGTGGGGDDFGWFGVRARNQKLRELDRLGNCGRQANAHRLRRQALQPRQAQRQQIAAFGSGKGMQLVQHDIAQRFKCARGG